MKKVKTYSSSLEEIKFRPDIPNTTGPLAAGKEEEISLPQLQTKLTPAIRSSPSGTTLRAPPKGITVSMQQAIFYFLVRNELSKYFPPDGHYLKKGSR
jgi:hypothetical protein